jgi:hypothetical protein
VQSVSEWMRNRNDVNLAAIHRAETTDGLSSQPLVQRNSTANRIKYMRRGLLPLTSMS